MTKTLLKDGTYFDVLDNPTSSQFVAIVDSVNDIAKLESKLTNDNLSELCYIDSVDKKTIFRDKVVDSITFFKETEKTIYYMKYRVIVNLKDAVSDEEMEMKERLNNISIENKENTRKIESIILEQTQTNKKIEDIENASSINASVLFLAKMQAQTLDNETSLQVKDLYDKWEDIVWNGKSNDIPTRDSGFKFTYNNKLYYVVNDNTQILPNWIPGTVSIYEEINESNKGTKEDPIPYSGNMELFRDKYYSQDGSVYLCIRDTGQAVTHNLHDLVGHFVQLA